MRIRSTRDSVFSFRIKNRKGTPVKERGKTEVTVVYLQEFM